MLERVHHKYEDCKKYDGILNMAKEIETYEGMLVFEATTRSTLYKAMCGTLLSDIKPPYAVRIPEGIAAIKAGAFCQYDDLGAIIMPDSVRIIGRNAFYYCDKLTKVVLSGSLRVIGASAFEGCDELTEIRIPDSVSLIEPNAFARCVNLKEIHIKNADLLKGQDLEEDVRIIQETLLKEKLDEAVAFCSGNDTGMLLLPLVVCRGLQHTHFFHRVGLWNKMIKIVNLTDWTSDGAVNSLLLMRTVLLDELKQSRFVDFGYSYFDEYNLRRNKRLASISVEEIDLIVDLLEKLCHYEPVTMENPFGEDYCIDDYDDYDPIMKELRDKYDLILPRYVALNFLLNDDSLKELAGKDLYNYTSDDREDYSEGLLSKIYKEMYRSIHYVFTGRMVGGKRADIEGAYRASDVFAEYEIDKASLPVFWKSDDKIELIEEELVQKVTDDSESEKPRFAATVEENGDISFGGLFRMVSVKGGTFQMGASGKCREEAYEDEFPVHEVTLGDYYIGQTTVTADLWLRVMENEMAPDDRISLSNANWFECQKFISKLNSLTEGKYNFSLPTEAQWEFAARGGMKSEGYKFSGSDNIDEVAWYKGNSDNKMHPVASLKPNELGIYDMSGNIGEWCKDEWDAYPDEALTDPEPKAEDAFKIIRGGSYSSLQSTCRVSNRRVCWEPACRSLKVGFRLAMTILKQ